MAQTRAQGAQEQASLGQIQEQQAQEADLAEGCHQTQLLDLPEETEALRWGIG
jgi:hypothetical protein